MTKFGKTVAHNVYKLTQKKEIEGGIEISVSLFCSLKLLYISSCVSVQGGNKIPLFTLFGRIMYFSAAIEDRLLKFNAEIPTVK